MRSHESIPLTAYHHVGSDVVLWIYRWELLSWDSFNRTSGCVDQLRPIYAPQRVPYSFCWGSRCDWRVSIRRMDISYDEDDRPRPTTGTWFIMASVQRRRNRRRHERSENYDSRHPRCAALKLQGVFVLPISPHFTSPRPISSRPKLWWVAATTNWEVRFTAHDSRSSTRLRPITARLSSDEVRSHKMWRVTWTLMLETPLRE